MKLFRFSVLLTVMVFMGSGVKAQHSLLKEGNKIYISSDNKQDHAKEVKEELIRQMKDWGYWKVSSSKKDADMILNVSILTHRGMTAWSWGGVTVRASVSIEDKSGEMLWQSKEYKANPNGTNGFNTARATIEKIVKEMQRRFK